MFENRTKFCFLQFLRGFLKTLPPDKNGGAEEIRTPDPHNAIVVLYQLSYDPIQKAGHQSKFSPPQVKAFRRLK
jgi:hypothetical protein